MQKQVHPVHFEDFSGNQFERLCFAYLVRRHASSDVDWYGQLGGDSGRDIVIETKSMAPTIVQCANFKRLTFAKAKEDLAKLSGGRLKTDAEFLMIVGGAVSASMKEKVKSEAGVVGFLDAKVWSGGEFEELLRRDTPDLLKRFTGGEPFPELPAELEVFAADSGSITDQKIIDGLIAGLDRPAMRTPFHNESSIPKFEKALAEIIDLLNTGKTPQGSIIPSKRAVRDSKKREELDLLVEDIVRLRAAYDQLKREGEIRLCGCGVPDCPVFTASGRAIHKMDQIRGVILKRAKKLSDEVPNSLYNLQ